MNEATQLAVYGSLVFAGLAGSLHCMGMCGPILLAFSKVFERTIGSNDGGDRGGLLRDFACYHLGRIWTYGLLGFVAGLAGRELRAGAAVLGAQRAVSLLICGTVILTGVLLWGRVPGLRLDAILTACGARRVQGWPWFQALISGRGITSRLLLGAVMGLLPCGLVYAMLVVVAALPGPGHAAVGMLLFGVGTLPSLSAVLIAGRSAPGWLRIHGTRLAAATLILAGSLMLVRTLVVSPETACPVCTELGSGTVEERVPAVPSPPEGPPAGPRQAEPG